MNGTWQDLARSLNLIINNDLNMTIIVANIVSWAKNLIMALVYMEYQLRVCQSQNLSLSLKKLHIFVKRFEFVGVNVCIDGNRPAQSKHQLIKTWPAQNWSATLQSLLDSFSYMLGSSPTSKSASRPSGSSFRTSIRTTWNHTGPLPPRLLLTRCAKQFFLVLAYAALIIANCLSFAPTSPPMVLAMLPINKPTMSSPYPP